MIKKIIASALVAVALAGCGGGEDETYSVYYKVTGSTDRAGLTLRTSSGGTAQLTVNLPYTDPAMTFAKGDFLYISAQNERSSGSVTTTIYVDGKPWKSTTSSGAYVIATASGSCC
jgi:hypothetical protein